MVYTALRTRDPSDTAPCSAPDSAVGSRLPSTGLFGRLVRQLNGGTERSGTVNAVSASSSVEGSDHDHSELDSLRPEAHPTCQRLHSRRAPLQPRGLVAVGASSATACTTRSLGAGVVAASPGKADGKAGEYDPEGAFPYDPDGPYSDGSDEDGDDSGDGTGKVDMQRLFNKISGRLLPLFFLMVIMCYMDRTSLAFAAIQLNADLDFAPTVYGMGSGLFFLGYSLFQVPSNLLLRRFGGPAWLAGIIAAWGLVASAFATMSTAGHFYALRLLLGATEAGAFPGMWYILTTFFPGDQITFPFAVVEAGISLSHVVAAPLAAACLSLDGLGGLAGWRWLFVLEGLPTLVLAVAMYRLLPRSPETADFLTASERKALLARIESHDRSGHTPLLESDPKGSSGGGGVNGLKCVSSVAGGLGGGAAASTSAGSGGPGGGSSIVKRAKARGTSDCGSLVSSSNLGMGACGGGVSGGAGGGAAGGSGSSWSAVRLAVTNKYVWYLGALKFVRDIASFGIIFWAPTIVNSLLQDVEAARKVSGATAVEVREGRQLLGGAVMDVGHHGGGGGGGGTGAAAVLLTALPFALAALCGMALAHSSQRTGERCLHIGLPYILTGGVLTMYAGASDRSPWLGFVVLSLGVVGVYCGSGPCLSLLSELAAGPGLVVALPMYNSLGTLGGFLGPSLVGWLVQRAHRSAASPGPEGSPHTVSAAAAIRGGGFGVSAVVLGCALCLAGLMMLGLAAKLGRLCGSRDGAASAGVTSAHSGAGGVGAAGDVSVGGGGRISVVSTGLAGYAKVPGTEGREPQLQLSALGR